MKTKVNIAFHNSAETAESSLPVPTEPTHVPDLLSSHMTLESLQRKQRAASLLGQLTPEQKVQLFTWLREHSLNEVRRLVAAAPPDGFGIQTHTTTLQRLRAQDRIKPQISAIREALDSVDHLNDCVDLSKLDFLQKGISALLHHFAFYLAQSDPSSAHIPKVLDSINKLSTLEHKRQQLSLLRDKLRHDSPHSPRRHQVDLNIVRPVTATPPGQSQLLSSTSS